jgi:hypothetical protein
MGIAGNILTILMEEAGNIFLGILIIVSIGFLLKKDSGKAVGFFITAIIVAVVVYLPDTAKQFILDLVDKILPTVPPPT